MTPIHHAVANADGTITAIIADAVPVSAESSLLSIWLPAGTGESVAAGRYFLARCGPRSDEERFTHWSIYRRRVLYAGGERPSTPGEKGDLVRLLAPRTPDDPGYGWLLSLPPDAAVNLIGPLGQAFQTPSTTRNLLLASDLRRVWQLLPLIEPLLNRGGRVSLLLRDASGREEALLRRLPVAVEVQGAPSNEEWRGQLEELLPWADQLCAALPPTMNATLADAIRRRRFHLTRGFASVLVEADIVCGYGACLACVVPRAGGGYTRACAHGPVFDLAELA